MTNDWLGRGGCYYGGCEGSATSISVPAHGDVGFEAPPEVADPGLGVLTGPVAGRGPGGTGPGAGPGGRFLAAQPDAPLVVIGVLILERVKQQGLTQLREVVWGEIV